LTIGGIQVPTTTTTTTGDDQWCVIAFHNKRTPSTATSFIPADGDIATLLTY
jgi:hypothetical protein